MQTMRDAFGLPVGLSDHTTGLSVPIAAAALGAAFVEKHFTLDRQMPGPDHPFALEPPELAALVAGIRDAESALGDGRKNGPSPEEREEMYVLARRSVIAARDLPKGTVLEPSMITVKGGPASGSSPRTWTWSSAAPSRWTWRRTSPSPGKWCEPGDPGRR